MADAVFRGSKAELKAKLRAIPAVLAGRAPDPHGIALGVQLRVGVAFLSEVQQDFLTKSRGGTGNDGITWPPLSKEYLAYGRRLGPGEAKSLGVNTRTERHRGLLTAAQNKRWKHIYGTRLARLRLSMGEGEARARAAQIAWAVLKSEGAKTKLDVYGNRQVDIGRDTGRMLRSLSPGVDAQPSGEAEQVFRTGTGTVVVGTNVEYAARFAERRPFWAGEITDAQMPGVRLAMRRGVQRAIELITSGAA